jgi:S-sulfo-L-cysteine synthase (O-acetyl-L-serine-dependent)
MPDILSLIGNTPLVPIKLPFDKPGVQLFGKMEGHNPSGSVKDRAALGMLIGANPEPGTHFIEATSGNTGISLAMIARVLNLKMTLVMPDNSTPERIQTMQAFGAEVILTPAKKTIEYSRVVADQLALENGFLQLNQFANDHNWKAHFTSTGPEIWKDTEGEITHFVSAMGTTGTIMGVGKYLKSKNPDIHIIGVQPADQASIPGIRRWSEAFLPKIFDPTILDRTIDVGEEEARKAMLYNASVNAIFGGLSAGGATAASIELCKKIEKGVVVCIICDRGDRYLSSGYFGERDPIYVE